MRAKRSESIRNKQITYISSSCDAFETAHTPKTRTVVFCLNVSIEVPILICIILEKQQS